MMAEWFCTKCKCVFHANEKFAKCCGAIEPFDVSVHGKQLVGLSNSWVSVWKHWENHPLLREASDEVHASGNYGTATILNVFIRHLLENTDEQVDEATRS